MGKKRKKIKCVLPETYVNAMLSYYNIMYTKEIKCISKIPDNIMRNLMLYDESELLRPYMALLARKGKSYRHIADLCGLPEGVARTVWSKYKR